MPYKLIIKTLAEQEIKEALAWYKEQNESLFPRLYKEIQGSFKKLKISPHQYQRRYREIRILFLNIFPYGIYYTIEGKTIYVHAFLHTKQNPEQLSSRI